jgi:hypothetical protein
MVRFSFSIFSPSHQPPFSANVHWSWTSPAISVLAPWFCCRLSRTVNHPVPSLSAFSAVPSHYTRFLTPPCPSLSTLFSNWHRSSWCGTSHHGLSFDALPNMVDTFQNCSCSDFDNCQGYRSIYMTDILTRFLETAPWSCWSR